MPRFKYSLLAAVGLLLLVSVISLIGPKRALAALGFTPVRDVDQPARQPFATSISVFLPAGTGNDFAASANVPAGKRFVIETISGIVFGPSGQRFSLDMAATTSGVEQPYNIPLNFTYTKNSEDFFSFMQSCRIYCDPGTPIQFIVDRNAASGSTDSDLVLSGYLVDLP